MKILVVTGSPREGGNSDMLADAFIEGAKEAGHEIRRIDAGRANINGCKSCYYCFSHEGQCVQQDDMQGFYEDMEWCEALVYASPMYFYTYTAQIKAFMDRQFCALGGRKFGMRKTALLCPFEDQDIHMSDGFIDSFKIAMGYAHQEIVGIVLSPATFEKGVIEGKPALDEARELGRNFA